MIVSHDETFLRNVGITRRIELGGLETRRTKKLEMAIGGARHRAAVRYGLVVAAGYLSIEDKDYG